MPRVKMLVDKTNEALPGKFDFTYNEREVLLATVPKGQGWYLENQADKNELLYSKKATGEHLVDGKGGPEGKLGKFIAETLASA
jgi:hypothetical protein